MSEQQPPAPGDPQSSGGAPVPLTPLLSDDPPKIGDFWLDARLIATPSGVAYAGHDDANTPVMLLLLSEGAADDPAARDRLAGLVNQLHIDTVIARGGHGQDEGRLGNKYRHESDDPVDPDDAPLAPWVALAYDGSPAAIGEAGRILDEVALARLPLQGTPAGPDYRLHWIDRVGPRRRTVVAAALARTPRPGRLGVDSGVVVVDAAARRPGRADRDSDLPAVAPAEPHRRCRRPARRRRSRAPRSPQSGSPSPQSGSPSPQSGSPSPQSGSPSPQSGSPSPQSGSPSPQSGSPGAGQPTPNSRL